MHKSTTPDMFPEHHTDPSSVYISGGSDSPNSFPTTAPCLVLERGSIAISVSRDPDRCGRTKHIVNLCSLTSEGPQQRVYCEFLRGADLIAAAEALLEMDRLLKAGIDADAFKDHSLPVSAVGLCHREDRSTRAT